MSLSDVVYPSMKQVTTFLSPRKIIFGVGSRSNVSEEIRRLRRVMPLVVTYSDSVMDANVRDTVGMLESAGMNVGVYDKVEPEPSIETAEDLAVFTRKGGFDLVIGMGGGSVMDLAKIASMSAANPGQVKDYLGFDLVSEKGAPLICMPTTSGTGSEVTMFSDRKSVV